MSLRRYRNTKTGEMGYIDVEDDSLDKIIEKNRREYEQSLNNLVDAYAPGDQFPAEYSYISYIIHVTIAVIIGGFIWSALEHPVIGLLIGIAVFVISLFIHWRRHEGSYAPLPFSAFKNSYLKKIILYTVITAAIIIGIKIIA